MKFALWLFVLLAITLADPAPAFATPPDEICVELGPALADEDQPIWDCTGGTCGYCTPMLTDNDDVPLTGQVSCTPILDGTPIDAGTVRDTYPGRFVEFPAPGFGPAHAARIRCGNTKGGGIEVVTIANYPEEVIEDNASPGRVRLVPRS